MPINSPYPYFFIMGFLLLVAWACVRYIPFYRDIVDKEDHGRYETLDGLRGILALGVLFQHAITNHYFFTYGVWQITDERFYRFLGGEAVIIFFMITSFLYWSKAIAKKGNFNMVSLYTNRFLRLAPLYLFSAGAVTLLLLISQNFQITSLVQFVKDTLTWFTLGIITTTVVDGISIIPFNAGIHWTLHFEWIFYLVLPVAALVLTKTPMRYLSIPILAIVLLSPYRGYWAIFLFGILGAFIVNKFPSIPFLSRKAAAIIPVLGLVAVYFINDRPYSYIQYAITLAVFLCFIYGNDLLGLLRTKSAKFLGTLSYSVYLLHGIVLHLVLSAANEHSPISSMNSYQFWGLILVSGVLTIGVSILTYRYIEHPFLQQIAVQKKVEKD